MKQNIIGSMLSPFCYYNNGAGLWWIMLCGFQFVKNGNKIKITTVTYKQWTIKPRWLFIKSFYNGCYKDYLKEQK